MLPPHRAELSTLHRELASGNWLPVETTSCELLTTPARSISTEPWCGYPVAPRSRQRVQARSSRAPPPVLPPAAPPIAATRLPRPSYSCRARSPPMLPPRDHERRQPPPRQRRDDPSRDARDSPSRRLVPYRLDTPPSSPVTQQKQRLVSDGRVGPRLPPAEPARTCQRLLRADGSRQSDRHGGWASSAS